MYILLGMNLTRFLTPCLTTVSVVSVTLLVTACTNRPSQISGSRAPSPEATVDAPAAPLPQRFATAESAAPPMSAVQQSVAKNNPTVAAPPARATTPAETPLWPVSDEPADGEGRFRRVSTVRRDGSKYPLIRREQVMRRTASGDTQLSTREMVADHLTVTMTDGGLSRLAGLLPAGFAIKAVIPRLSTAIVSIPVATAADFPASLAFLKRIDGVVAVDADGVNHLSSTVPSDPGVVNQINVRALGLAAAWDVSTGSKAVKVAVIDSGVDITHQDLAANIWENPGEVAGAMDVDDDENGYADDLHGWNFVAGNNDVSDVVGHGTSVAGIIGAVGDNEIGMAGIAWNVTLVPLRVTDENGVAFDTDVASAIDYAGASGCQVANISLGSRGALSTVLKSAIDDAKEKGLVCVCAAGNDGVDNDSDPFYPASYRSDNVISVTSLQGFGQLDPTANTGAGSVDIAAPGDFIYTTIPFDRYGDFSGEQGYDFFFGTSAAAPQVSGALALVLSYIPTATSLDAKDLLLSNAQQLTTLDGNVAGSRSLTVGGVLSPGTPSQVLLATIDNDSVNPYRVQTGDVLTVNLTLRNISRAAASTDSQLHVSVDPSLAEIMAADGTSVGEADFALPALAIGESLVYQIRIGALPHPGSPVRFSSISLNLRTTDGTQDDSFYADLRTYEVNNVATPSTALPITIGDSIASPRRGGAYVINPDGPALLRLGADQRRLVQSSTPIDAPSTGFAIGRSRLAVSPDERFLYIANSVQQTIHRFALPAMDQKRFNLAFAPRSIVVGRDGSLYVTRLDNPNEIHRLDGQDCHPIGLETIVDEGPGNDFPQANLLLKTDVGGNKLWAFQHLYNPNSEAYARPIRIFQLSSAGARFEQQQYFFGFGFADFVPVGPQDRCFVVHAQDPSFRPSTSLTSTTPPADAGSDGAHNCFWAENEVFTANAPTVRGYDGKVWVPGRTNFSRVPMVAVHDVNTRSWINGESVFLEKEYNVDAGYRTINGFPITEQRVLLIGGVYDHDISRKLSRIAIAGPGMTGAPVNNLPVAHGTVVAPTVGHTASFSLAGSSDPDGGRLSWRWEFGDGTSTGGTLGAGAVSAPISHTFRGGSVPNGGTVNARLLVTDAEGLTDAVQIPVVIDQGPTLASTTVSVSANRSASVTLAGQDADGDTLTYRVTTTGVTVSARIVGSKLTVTPQANWIGSTTVTVVAFDGFMESEPATITVTVVGSGLPVPWTAVDTTRAHAGRTTYDWNTGVYRIRGTGDGSRVADPGFSGLAATMSGDGTLTAKILPWPVAGTRRPTDAGLLIREYALPDSRVVMIGLGADDRPFWAVRSQHGGPVERTVIAGVAGNARWLRLKREGNDLTGQVSVDGSVWVAAGRTTLPFVTASELCLVQTTGAAAAVAATEFANVALRFVQPTSVAFPLRVNFQPVSAPAVPGYRIDDGAQYGVRAGGVSFGWDMEGSAAVDRNSPLSVAQHPAEAQLYDTLVSPYEERKNRWSVTIPNGRYTVRVVAGDPWLDAGKVRIAANGVTVVTGELSKAVRWLDGSAMVTVSDGRLRMTNAAGGTLFRPAFLVITPVPAPPLPTGGG